MHYWVTCLSLTENYLAFDQVFRLDSVHLFQWQENSLSTQKIEKMSSAHPLCFATQKTERVPCSPTAHLRTESLLDSVVYSFLEVSCPEVVQKKVPRFEEKVSLRSAMFAHSDFVMCLGSVLLSVDHLHLKEMMACLKFPLQEHYVTVVKQTGPSVWMTPRSVRSCPLRQVRCFEGLWRAP